MDAAFEVITFDRYGTLIDWEEGIRTVFGKAAAQDGVRLDESRIIETYATNERKVEAEGYRSYRSVLSESAAHTNVDDDLLEGTRRHFPVAFDIIVTAHQVKSYKPDRAHFEEARRKIGNHRWMHAAQSNFHDIVPANALASRQRGSTATLTGRCRADSRRWSSGRSRSSRTALTVHR